MPRLKVWDEAAGVWREFDAVPTDHGVLAGLGDDDHSIYVLVDGSRDMTGDLTIRKASLPALVLRNSTASDADAARRTYVNLGGLKADLTEHALGALLAEHAGASADTNGRLALMANGGGGLVRVVDMTGSDLLSHFTGEVRHTHARRIHAGRTSAGPQAFPASTQTTIQWVAASRADTGFTLGGTSGNTITVGFDGKVRISYQAYWNLDVVPGFVEAFTQAYLNGAIIPRSGMLSSHLSIGGTPLLGYGGGHVVTETAVTNGDTIQVRTTVNAGGALDLAAQFSGILVERIQGDD